MNDNLLFMIAHGKRSDELKKSGMYFPTRNKPYRTAASLLLEEVSNLWEAIEDFINATFIGQ